VTVERAIRRARRRYHTLVADPPWRFDDQLPGPARGASKHYTTLSLDELLEYPLPPLYGDGGEGSGGARLFLWRVAAMQDAALALMAAWGFELKSELVWVKVTRGGLHRLGLAGEGGGSSSSGLLRIGMGRQVRMAHEVCLIGVRGKVERLSAAVPSVLFAERSRGVSVDGGRGSEHSRKPAAFYDLVERLSPGPYCELFAREQRPGWTVYGDELRP